MHKPNTYLTDARTGQMAYARSLQALAAQRGPAAKAEAEYAALRWEHSASILAQPGIPVDQREYHADNRAEMLAKLIAHSKGTKLARRAEKNREYLDQRYGRAGGIVQPQTKESSDESDLQPSLQVQGCPAR